MDGSANLLQTLCDTESTYSLILAWWEIACFEYFFNDMGHQII